MSTTTFIVSCEHASNALPEGTDLGVQTNILHSHVGWDLGAAEVALTLGEHLKCATFLGRFSRLWVDLNRSSTEPGVIPAVAFGVTIPGNYGLSPKDRSHRLSEWYRFRTEVTTAIEHALHIGSCIHLSIHSFTHSAPASQGFTDTHRNFDIGLLFDPNRPWEQRLACSFQNGLQNFGWNVAENRPYLGTDDGHTTSLRQCWSEDQYAGIEVEIGQRISFEDRIRFASNFIQVIRECLPPQPTM